MATATMSAREGAAIVRPIRNGREFEHAVAELDRWAELDPGEGTPEYDRMELLGILIAAYEEDHLPRFKPSSPQDLVKFMAAQRGITPAQFAALFGGRSRLSEFLNGKRELSKAQIIRLRDRLGIPADVLLR